MIQYDDGDKDWYDLGKDKSKVIDEQWDDARVKSFLAYRAHDGTPDGEANVG